MTQGKFVLFLINTYLKIPFLFYSFVFRITNGVSLKGKSWQMITNAPV